MSKRELGRVEALARVRSKQLRVVDAAQLMRVSYRQAKGLWERDGGEGAAGLKHRSEGRATNPAFHEKFLQKGAGGTEEGRVGKKENTVDGGALHKKKTQRRE